MVRMLQHPGRIPVCLAPVAMWPAIVRADGLANAPPGSPPEWTLADTFILIALLLLLVFFSLAVYASLLHLKKDITTTDSTLKKILLTPLFIFLLLLALCMLPLTALYWWLQPLLAKTSESRPDEKNVPPH